MEVLFWYLLACLFSAVYIKVMHSQGFWKYLFLAIGLTPLFVMFEAWANKPPLRIWYKTGPSAKGSVKGTTTVNTSSVQSTGNNSSRGYTERSAGRSPDELRSAIILDSTFDHMDDYEDGVKQSTPSQVQSTPVYVPSEPVQEERSSHTPSYSSHTPSYSSSSHSSRDDSYSSPSSSYDSGSSSSYD